MVCLGASQLTESSQTYFGTSRSPGDNFVRAIMGPSLPIGLEQYRVRTGRWHEDEAAIGETVDAAALCVPRKTVVGGSVVDRSVSPSGGLLLRGQRRREAQKPRDGDALAKGE